MGNEKKYTRTERSWILYDWANSVYATIVMAAILPAFFASYAPDGDVWWGYGTSIATFVVAVLAPVLGAIGDYTGMKKKLLIFFMALGVVFTSVMAFVGDWKLMLIGYIISYIGFSGSCLFYDSFLTDVTTTDRMDRVSAMGYAMGYIGGSTIPFIIAILLMFLMEDSVLAVKLSLILTSVWWLVFSIPILKNVHQTHSLGKLPKRFMGDAFRNVGKTFMSIVKRRGLLLFILAYFFYIDGVGTVIHMSTAYGSAIGLGTVGMVLALFVTQVVAAPFSMLFARFSKKIGSIKMLTIAIGVYFIICVTGFYMGYSLEGPEASAKDAYYAAFDAAAAGQTGEAVTALREAGLAVINKSDRVEQFSELAQSAGLDATTQDALTTALMQEFNNNGLFAGYDKALLRSSILFWCMAVLVGTCQGGIQALSRSYLGKLIPPEKSNEYFGFFDIFGKFAAVIGPFLYATVAAATGRPSLGILSLMLLFAIGGCILIFGKNTITKEERAETGEA